MKIIDYTESFERCVRAEGKGRNVLILNRLEESFKRFDGKLARYQLEHRWLSEECADAGDQAWACTQGSDFTYWQAREIQPVLHGTSLFDAFSLIS